MKKSIIAVIVLSSVASFAANATNTFDGNTNESGYDRTQDSVITAVNNKAEGLTDKTNTIAQMVGTVSREVGSNATAIANNASRIEAVNGEVSDNADAIVSNSAAIQKESEIRDTQVHTISSAFTQHAQAEAAKMAAETTARESADSAMQQKINGDEMAQANRDRTANQRVTQQPVVGHDGANGKDGVSITGKKGAQGVSGVDGRNGVNGRDGKDADMTQVNANTAGVAANRSEIITHSRAINTQGAAIAKNSQRIDRNSKDIAENRKAIKRVGAMASAASNLHYNRAENGYAVSVGEYAGSTAVAGGVQFNTSANTAVTVQASYDGENVGASVGFHGSW